MTVSNKWTNNLFFGVYSGEQFMEKGFSEWLGTCLCRISESEEKVFIIKILKRQAILYSGHETTLSSFNWEKEDAHFLLVDIDKDTVEEVSYATALKYAKCFEKQYKKRLEEWADTYWGYSPEQRIEYKKMHGIRISKYYKR